MKISISRQILPALAIIAIIISALLIYNSQPDTQSATPEIAPPRAGNAMGDAIVAGSGVVEPSSELITLGTHVPGVIDEVMVKAGDIVTKGQPLFTLDMRDINSQIEQERARINRLNSTINAAKTRLNTAKKQAALYDNVDDRRAYSQKELITIEGQAADAEAALSVAAAELQEAKAALNSALTMRERYRMDAPISGEILQVEARPGQFAATMAQSNNAPALIIMGQTNPLHVRVDIDESEIERVDMGKAATIMARGNATRRYRARFVRMEPLVIPKKSLTNAANERVDVRVMQLIFAVEGTDNNLVVGQQVDAFLPAKKTVAQQRNSQQNGAQAGKRSDKGGEQ